MFRASPPIPTGHPQGRQPVAPRREATPAPGAPQPIKVSFKLPSVEDLLTAGPGTTLGVGAALGLAAGRFAGSANPVRDAFLGATASLALQRLIAAGYFSRQAAAVPQFQDAQNPRSYL